MIFRSRFIAAMLLLCLITGLSAAQTPTEPAVLVSRWDGVRRFNVLVMGMDRRPQEKNTLQVRTDALMLISLDPATQSIGVLHIPRDLHVSPLPDSQIVDLLRVNTLVLRGEELQEGYGPYYLMDTLGYNVGMYIDAFVAFDFDAFIKIVDTLGGVELTTEYNIYDSAYPDMNYGYDPFYLPAGTHTLDGETALKFARTRHSDNDYVRGQRQMQVMKAIAQKAADPQNLPRLLLNARALMVDLRDDVVTDLTLDELIQIAQYGSSIGFDAIKTGGVNEAYIDYTYQKGSSLPVLDRVKLPELLESIFGENYSG